MSVSNVASQASNGALPPGPSLPLPVQTAKVHRDVAGFFDAAFRRYGDMFTIRVYPMGDVVVVAQPEMAKEVFTGDEGVFRAGEVNQIAEPMIGSRSVFLLDDPGEHLRTRRFLLPPFHGERITRYAERIAEISRREMEGWPEGQKLSIRPGMQAIAMEVILRIVYGIQDQDRLDEMRRRLVAMRGPLESVILFPWLRRNLGPKSPWMVFQRRRAAVDEMIFELIERGRTDPALADRDDILAMLLQARDEDGEPMPENEIRDTLLTLVVAGYETTATGLAWAVERLAWNPKVLDRLRGSVERGEEEYLDAVVRETLRVRPPLWHIGRRLARDTQVNGHTLPAGVVVVVPLLLVHRRPDLYPEPLAFRPERFLEGKPPSYGWIPFGGGVRRCIGASFAPFEMRIVLRELVRRFVIRPARSKPEKIKLFHVTIVPEHGGSVVLERIAQSVERSAAIPSAEPSAAIPSAEPSPDIPSAEPRCPFHS